MEKDFFRENSIGLLILAGGRSSRMGRPKADLQWGNMTMIEHIARNMGDFQEKILSVGAKDKAGDLLAEFAIMPDPEALAGKGPAAGIVTALAQCQSQSLMVVPCDTPFVDRGLAMELAKAFCQKGQQGKEGDNVPVIAQGQNGPEPLIGIYPRAVVEIMEKGLQQGIFKALDLLELTGYESHTVADYKLRNINSPEDYRAIKENKNHE